MRLTLKVLRAELAEQCFVTANDTVYVHVARAFVLRPAINAHDGKSAIGRQLREKVTS